METIEFDIRGQICPSTLLTALKEINRHRTSLKNGNCMLVFLTAGVFFLFVLARRLATDHWFGAHELKIAAHAWRVPRPMTPSPQELSISRT